MIFLHILSDCCKINLSYEKEAKNYKSNCQSNKLLYLNKILLNVY